MTHHLHPAVAVIVGLSFPMKLSIRDLWSQSKLGHVHAGLVNYGAMRPLLRRGLVVLNSPRGFTLSPLGVEVVEALESEWVDHVEAEFGDVTKGWAWKKADKKRMLVSMADRRTEHVKGAEAQVARCERYLTTAKSAVALLQLDPVFNQEGS